MQRQIPTPEAVGENRLVPARRGGATTMPPAAGLALRRASGPLRHLKIRHPAVRHPALPHTIVALFR